MRKIKLFLILCFLLNIDLFAQINHFNIFKSYQSTLCCPKDVYGLEIQMNYVVFTSEVAELEIPIGLYWGLLENIEVGAQFTGVSKSQGSEILKGVEDILLAAKYNFIKEDKNLVTTFPTISAEFGLSLPTGDYKKGFGVGGVGFVLNWLLEKCILLRSEHFFNLIFNFGYKVNAQNPEQYKVGDMLFYTFGSYFDLKENFIFSFGAKGINKKSDKLGDEKISDTESNESYIFFGINYELDKYRRFFSSVSLGLNEDAKDFVFNIGMMY
jgi:hypothetical protein